MLAAPEPVGQEAAAAGHRTHRALATCRNTDTLSLVVVVVVVVIVVAVIVVVAGWLAGWLIGWLVG